MSCKCPAAENIVIFSEIALVSAAVPAGIGGSVQIDCRNGELRVFDDSDSLVRALSKLIFDEAEYAIKQNGVCTLALSGGSTPKALYKHLAAVYKDKLDWSRTLFFLVDERCVAHDDPESNFKMINEALFSGVPLGKENIFATENQDKDPKDAALKYEAKMLNAIAARSGKFPVFDIILLGLGSDGHTASLFPETKALKEEERCFVENWVDKFKSYRLTSTYSVLNAGRNVIFLVSGREKSEILDWVLNSTQQRYPAQQIHPSQGKLAWYVDKLAVASLHHAHST